MAGANETYTIDIQAAIPEGGSVAAKLEALTSALTGANDSAKFFDAATKEVSRSLAAAKAATADTSAALAEGNLQWSELEANALRASKAFEKASARGPVTREIAEEAQAAQVALASYAVTLEGIEHAAAEARTTEQALALALGQTRDAAREAKETAEAAEAAARAPAEAAKAHAQELGNLKGSLAALPGPLGRVASAVLGPAQGFKKLAGGMGESRAAALAMVAGAAAVAAAIVAVTAVVVIGTVKIAAWAVGLADAARNSALATEAFNAMNPALAGLDFAGLAAETGLSASALQGFAKDLSKAGVEAEDLPGALRAAALSERALGAGGAQDFIASLKDAKGSVGELANATQSKLGGIVARQMMGLDAQGERLSRNIDGLFGGLDIDPILAGFGKLVALFDKNTAAGEALKFLFESVFQPLIDTADTAATAIEAFYLGVMIGAMQLYIDLKPTIKAVKEFFGLDSSELEVSFESITELGKLLAPVFAVIAAVVGVVLVSAFAAIGAAIAVNVAAWYLLIEAIKLVVAAFTWVVDAVVGAYDYVAAIDWGVLGQSLIDGFVGGIKAGAGAVVSAITGVVGGAIGAAKRMLGISSPSKVFLGIGEDTGAGFTGGVEESTDAAHHAIATMASPSEALNQAALSGDVGALDAAAGPPPSPAAAPGAAGAGAGASVAGARTVTLYNPIIQLGAGTPKEQAQEFVTWITELLEGDAAQAAGA